MNKYWKGKELPKKVEDRDNMDLLELTLELHTKAHMYPKSKSLHKAYLKARTELESRFK